HHGAQHVRVSPRVIVAAVGGWGSVRWKHDRPQTIGFSTLRNPRRFTMTPSTGDRVAVTAPDAPAAIGPYSHAVSHDGLLFCSGALPLDPGSGELVDDAVGAET